MPVLMALFVLALSGLSQAQDDGNHGVVLVFGHQFFRANNNFELSVKSSAAPLLHVTASIENTVIHSTISRNSSYLRPDETKRLWLPVGEVAHNGKYQLVVSITHNSITENATRDLLLMTVHRNVLIQTDKPQYRPGDIINYRVLVLDDKLRLAQDVPSLGLYLQNPTGDFEEHTDQTWQYDEFPGFFNGSFGPLPLEPEPGEWAVLVATSDRVKLAVKSIMVSDYERPRFVVDVSSASYVMRSDNNLHVNISLRDYFGQPISGIVDINLSTSKTADRPYLPQSVNGTSHFQLPIILDKITCENSATAADLLTVKVTAQASTTTRSLSAAITVPVFCDPLKLIASTQYQTFQPGTQFNVTIKAITHDGQPYVLTSKNPTPCSGRMEIDVESSLNGQESDPEEDENEENQLKIDNAIMLDSNTLVVPVTTPSNAGSIELKCRVAQAIRVFTFKEHSGNFAAIRTDVGRTYRVGDVVEFSLECAQGCISMDVVVVSESGILFTTTYNMVNEESGPLSLRVTAEMAPLTRIVAYHIASGFVGSDMAEFHVVQNSVLRNMTLTVTSENASRKHVLPGRGEKIQVDVCATKNALVGLLAVEKGLRQLDPDFDSIAKQIVNQKLPTDDLYDTVNGVADLSPFSSAGLVAQLFTLDSGGCNPAQKRKKKHAGTNFSSRFSRQFPVSDRRYQ
ncbi:thioester-containing protein 1 allele R1-like isoform X2 [Paramacrobiotus metropolitanus]|uniref:thioester-containing protein 1 allele R1-like isoform X2 n=1 Tax=Paramacrobiotus metropolitanus TaxID=2943436 RepID=UPI0024463908|nr:thioester-containing protein 1 allele R1-like isoform X2 [Paramacrobiotus metropolitanus]